MGKDRNDTTPDDYESHSLDGLIDLFNSDEIRHQPLDELLIRGTLTVLLRRVDFLTRAIDGLASAWEPRTGRRKRGEAGGEVAHGPKSVLALRKKEPSP